MTESTATERRSDELVRILRHVGGDPDKAVNATIDHDETRGEDNAVEVRWESVAHISLQEFRDCQEQPSVAEHRVVSVPAPTFGTETARAAQFLVDAAWKLRSGYTVGGSTVSGGIARLLDEVAGQLDPTARTTYDGHVPHPDEPCTVVYIAEMTYEERKALPAIYHRPVFDDYGSPASWRCAVCWDAESAVTHAWPCAPATAGGATLARHLGLEHTL